MPFTTFLAFARRLPASLDAWRKNKTALPVVSVAVITVCVPSFLILAIAPKKLNEWKTSHTMSVTYRDASDRLGYHMTWSSIFDTLFSAGVCVLDANGDGLDDVFIPGLGDFNTDPDYLRGYQLGNSLFLNRGVDASRLPVFENATETAGVQNTGKLGVGCAAADYNNDGHEDIVVVNATRGVSFSFYGGLPIGETRRLFPPSRIFLTDKTDGKYHFPDEGGVTLFRNDGVDEHGIPRFTDRTIEAGLTRGGNGTSAAWADVNTDGFVDLFVANYSDPDFFGYIEPRFAGQYNVLYRNNGDGTFSDLTDQAGIGGEAEFVYTPEGTKQYGWSPGVRDSQDRIVGDPAGNTLAAAFFDYTNDGLSDLLTADDIPGRIRLFENLGNFRFRHASDEHDFGIAGAWMGIGIGDINNDGAEDVFATNFGAPVSESPPIFERPDKTVMSDISRPPNRATYYNGLWMSRDGFFHNVAHSIPVDWGPWMPAIGWSLSPDRLMSSDTLQSSSAASGLQKGELGFGAQIFDHDNDGLQDIAWVGSLNQSASFNFGQRKIGNPGRLLKNLGQEKGFADVSRASGFGNLRDPADRTSYQNGRGLAVGDFNADGYYDIVITNAGGWDSGDPNIPRLSGIGLQYKAFSLVKEYRPGPTRLYVATRGSNNWLKVKLVGIKSNKSAIGARVIVAYREKDAVKKQVREVRAGESFASQKSLELIFGLGSATVVDEIVVRWPVRGNLSQVLRKIKANQRLVITEAAP